MVVQVWWWPSFYSRNMQPCPGWIYRSFATTQNLWFFRRIFWRFWSAIIFYEFNDDTTALQLRVLQTAFDTIPVKSASANVSFYTINSKMPNFLVVTLLSQVKDMLTDRSIYWKFFSVTQLSSAYPTLRNRLKVAVAILFIFSFSQ